MVPMLLCGARLYPCVQVSAFVRLGNPCVQVSVSVRLGNLDNDDVSDVGVSKEELWHSGNEKAGLEISNGSQVQEFQTPYLKGSTARTDHTTPQAILAQHSSENQFLRPPQGWQPADSCTVH